MEFLKSNLLESMEIVNTYTFGNFLLSMTTGQMQGSIITHICGIDSYSSGYQHVHNVEPSFFGCPMEKTKAMVISK